MIAAIIDMGTNTFNLLIQDLEKNELLRKDKISVKLGEGGLSKGYIAKEPFARGVAALQAHQKTISQFEVDETYAFATSAVRDAKNQEDFTKACFKEANIYVNVIDGKKEAELILEGVKQALPISEKKVLIVDIGGGSTECIIADKQQTHWLKSHNLGSSRLKETFAPGDPLQPNDIERVHQHLQKELSELLVAVEKYKPTVMIGSSGSFDTLASMIFEQHNRTNVLLNGETSYTFNLAEYAIISKLMRTSTYEERLKTPGMLPMRADLMPMATLLIDFLLNQTQIHDLKLSTYALKEGVSSQLKNNKHAWQKS